MSRQVSRISNEIKVGALFLTTLALVLFFGWLLGVQNPLTSNLSFSVTYHFAGGIEVGSPVRVSGIKVGKVEKIEFFSIQSQTVPLQKSASDPIEQSEVTAPLKIKISISKEAMPSVRRDSHFYINLAGIIGERYIEITPGHLSSPLIQSGDVLTGIDPPRIDQLISQSFNLAGTIKDLIEENKGDITRSIELLYKLSGNLNKTLTWVDKSPLFKTDLTQLVENLIAITSGVRKVTDHAKTPEGEKTLKLLYDLLWRLEPVNSQAIHQFFQKEGMKVHLF